jgi:ribosomal protein S1
MKHLTLIVAAILIAGASLVAHGDNDHVRGTVSAVSAQSITLQITAKTTTVLTVTPKTTFTKSGKAARLADLKVGDRVVVDVPKGTKEAEEIQIGVSATTAKPSK